MFAFDHSGNPVIEPKYLKESEIADYVGEEPARKLLESGIQQTESGRRQWKSIGGLDLKVGGEWAKALYDRAVPNFMNKYGKKWGAQVGESTLETGTDGDRTFTFPDHGTIRSVTNDLRTINGTASASLRTSPSNVLQALEDGKSMDDAMDSYGTQELVDAVGGKMKFGRPRTDSVHSIDITPAMKKSVLKEGQPISRLQPTQPMARYDT